MPRTVALLALVLLFAAATAARAQTCTATQKPNTVSSCTVSSTVGVNVVKSVSLSMSNAATTLATPAVADVDAGLQRVATSGPVLTVRANSAWVVNIKALNETWTAGAGGRVDKPASDLRWSLSASGTFTALSTAGSQLATGAATTAASYQLFFKAAYNWVDDLPGTYNLPVVLTITAP